MASAHPIPTSSDALTREIDDLRSRLAAVEVKLAEAQELIQAIQQGDVDAVVISGPAGDQVFSLKDAEYGYRALVEAMSEGAATLAVDGTVLYCNERLSHLLGVPLETIIGNHVTRHLSDETARVIEALLGHALSGESITTGLDLRTVEGRCIPVQISIREMVSIESAVCCMVVTDLTESKSRDELIAAGKLATLILQSAAEAIAVCDEGGKVIAGNQALEDLCGRNPLYQPFDEVLRLESMDGIDASSARILVTDALHGVTFTSRKVRLCREDGRVTHLLMSASPMRSSTSIAGCVLTMTDITERERAEEARLQSEKEAVQKGQLRALAGRLQHVREEERKKVARDLHDQIGQILTAIKMDMAWLLRHLSDTEGEVHRRIAGSIELINDGVRSVRRICSGLRPGVLDDLGLAAAIEWQANEFAARTGIAFNVTLPPSELRMDGDRATAIFRIFQECLTNVARHAEAKTVRTSLYEENENVILVVEDDGKGFYESEVAGSLGLLGMKERAQVCGGSIQVTSYPGKGTTVRVRVPARAAGADREDHANFDSR